MTQEKRILIVAGARPNFMKIAPLIAAFDAHNDSPDPPGLLCAWRLVHTGQHYDKQMSKIFFEELGIPEPDVNLEVGSGSHAVQTADVMTRFEGTCIEHQPDWVVVVGDVNSTLACTLVASKMGIRVAHVEAGLRSFDRTMPEEINRIVTDALADLLLTPSEDADDNLRREGVDDRRIRRVGNIMIDTLVRNLHAARSSRILHRQGLEPKEFVYVTLHRPSNVDQPEVVAKIMNVLTELSKQLPVVFPVHPRTRKMLNQFGIGVNGQPGMRVLDPLGYTDSLCLSDNARFVITDSGGLQEETTYLGTPCLTLRPNTERPVTITVGTNKLTTPESLPRDIQDLLRTGGKRGTAPPLWDGKTAERIVETILQH